MFYRPEDLFPVFDDLDHLRWWAGFDTMAELRIASGISGHDGLSGKRLIFRSTHKRGPSLPEAEMVAAACGVPVHCVIDASIRSYEKALAAGRPVVKANLDRVKKKAEEARSKAWRRRASKGR